jgi:hypothetical protein
MPCRKVVGSQVTLESRNVHADTLYLRDLLTYIHTYLLANVSFTDPVVMAGWSGCPDDSRTYAVLQYNARLGDTLAPRRSVWPYMAVTRT